MESRKQAMLNSRNEEGIKPNVTVADIALKIRPITMLITPAHRATFAKAFILCHLPSFILHNLNN